MKSLAVLLFFTTSALAQNWMLHDISILFPMPQRALGPEALRVNSAGLLGALLPATASARLPVLEPSLRRETQTQYFEVVGVRVDPPDVRLVWGVFSASGALDTSLHTFYRLNDERSFMQGLQKISQLTRMDVSRSLPLSVHPTLQRQGMNGEYARALRALLLKSIGEKNLYKLTFMSMSMAHLKWDFGGFMINNGTPTPLPIAKVNTDKVQVFINDSVASSFSGGMGPAPSGQNAFNRLISDSHKPQVSEASQLLEAHQTALRIENPHLENPSTVDCVSCHLAQPVKSWTETVAPGLAQSFQGLYVNRAFNLQNKSRDRSRTDNLHAFGWFENAPSVNQRAINESAFIAAKLNQINYHK